MVSVKIQASSIELSDLDTRILIRFAINIGDNVNELADPLGAQARVRGFWVHRDAGENETRFEVRITDPTGYTLVDLSDAWEQNPSAIVLSRTGSATTHTIPGPNLPSNVDQDGNSEYNWSITGLAFYDSLLAWYNEETDGTYFVTLSDQPALAIDAINSQDDDTGDTVLSLIHI